MQIEDDLKPAVVIAISQPYFQVGIVLLGTLGAREVVHEEIVFG